MRKPKDLKDRRSELGTVCTLADFKKVRNKNLKSGIWGCVCGSRKFHLVQDTENVKTVCVKCGDTEIIYWNGSKDSSSGSMRRLDTGDWAKIKHS